MATNYCPLDNFEAPYTELAISLILFLILQLWLLLHTLYYERKSYKKHQEIQRTKLSIRISYTLLQLCGLYWIIIDILRFLIDPYFQFLQNNSLSCGIAAYSPKIIVIIYFAIYLHQILLRLELSFRGSHLALSRNSIIVLSFFILIPTIIVPTAFFSALNSDNVPCVWKWSPIDITVPSDFAVCDYYNTGLASNIIGIGIIWIVLANITIGAIFGCKLKRVLRNGGDNDPKSSFKLKSLIIKNTILTTLGSVSTLFNWFAWLILTPLTGVGIFFLYFDVWFNCLCLALMFRYNENSYKQLCKYCIKCCLMDCDKTFDGENKKELGYQMQRIEKYLEPDNLSSIFSKTDEISTQTMGKGTVGIKSITSTTMSVSATPSPKLLRVMSPISDMVIDADSLHPAMNIPDLRIMPTLTPGPSSERTPGFGFGYGNENGEKHARLKLEVNTVSNSVSVDTDQHEQSGIIDVDKIVDLEGNQRDSFRL